MSVTNTTGVIIKTMKDEQAKFQEYRQKYPTFYYRNYSINQTDNEVLLSFTFEIPGLTTFTPEVRIPKKQFAFELTPESPLLHKIVFNIGLSELLSYWKVTCSPEIIIEASFLDEIELAFWKKQFYKGLGQFIFENGIKTSQEEFNRITIAANSKKFEIEEIQLRDENIIPVGGGKDSVVTLELLKEMPRNTALVVHTNFTLQSALNTAEIAGFEQASIFEVFRTIDSRLIELNKQGYLNGHTPVSIVFAFYGALASALFKKKNIVLSNESSANESSVPGSEVNHQYSKTFAVEQDLHNYFQHSFSKEMNYYSLLRPLAEIQIAREFTKYPQYFEKFISCNLGNKTNKWCENCSKCLFSSILMQAFMSRAELARVFKSDLLANENLLADLRGLIDDKFIKPLECVGTKAETAMALSLILAKHPETEPLPKLLQVFKDEYPTLISSTDEVNTYLSTFFDTENLIPEKLISKVKNVL